MYEQENEAHDHREPMMARRFGLGSDVVAPWRNLRWVFTAVWMIFLAYPITAVVTSGHSTVTKTIGLTILTVFACGYLWASVYLLTGRNATDLRGVPFFVLLTCLMVALLPIINENAFGAAPFLMVVAAFCFPTRWALLCIGAIVVFSVALPRLFGWSTDASIVLVLLAVGLTMVGFRFIAIREGEREREEERRRELDARLAIVAERERVARDVHDILGHSLTVISVKTELAQRLVELDPPRAQRELAEINHLTRDALARVRTTVGRMRTPDLPDTIAGADSALRAAGIEATLPDTAVATEHAELFAWVLRETVTNVVRHSGARHCDVRIDASRISVHDDGLGLGDAEHGNGLRGLRERVESAGGIVNFDSDATGTTVRVQIS